MIKDRKMNRLRNYDYSQSGYYYITICVHHELRKQNIFGVIDEGKMKLNGYGAIINNVWQNLPCHYNNCSLDEYIIMPDHFHGIVTIESGNNIICGYVGNGFKPFRNDLKPFPTGGTYTIDKKYGLPEIIRGFKTFSSRGINKIQNRGKFHWQKSYYDNIIRNVESLNRIRQYIINNPIN